MAPNPRKARSGWHDRRMLEVPLRFFMFAMPASLLYCIWNWRLGLFGFFFSAVYFVAFECMSAPPANRPEVFLSWVRRTGGGGDGAPRRPVLLCLGDSLTHGTASSSYTPEIPIKLSVQLGLPVPPVQKTFSDPLWVVNAGQNGLTSYVILHERLQKAMGVFPDYVLIFLGTNDVRGMYKSLWANELVYTHELPEPPTLQNYETYMRGIVSFIRQSSPFTYIGIVTLPPMGEDLRAPVNDWVRKANEVIVRVAASDDERRTTVVPLYEALEARIDKKGRKWALPVEYGMLLSLIMNPLYHLFGIVFTWNRMSAVVGNVVLTDALHLNDTGRDILVDLIVEWLMKSNIAKAIAVKR